MSVWYCVPSARQPQETTFALWAAKGYRIAVWRDPGAVDIPEAHLTLNGPYPGYAVASNRLVQAVLLADKTCDWVVCGGDDIEPDAAHGPEEIAQECSDWRADTFGVMQPTGDRWGDDQLARHMYGENRGAYIDRICGSPWIGREFALRINGGKGPFWPEYRHMFLDEELQEVAQKLGVLWQRRDLIHLHNHWGRKLGATPADCPEHLREVSGREHWEESKALFNARKEAGFPGHEALA